jgi:hypothetical protein
LLEWPSGRRKPAAPSREERKILTDARGSSPGVSGGHEHFSVYETAAETFAAER